MFTRSRQTRRNVGAKELGKAYNEPEEVMTRMKNYATRTSALPFLESIPEKSLGQSYGRPDRFTRFTHLLKQYLRSE